MIRIISFIAVCFFVISPQCSFPAEKVTQETKGSNSPNWYIGHGGTVINNNIGEKLPKLAQIHGSVAISKYTRADLDGLSGRLGIEKFDLSIDDPLLDEYYLIKLRLQNGGTTIEQPLTFAIATGIDYSKILDARSRVLTPRNKTINMRYSIPQVRWVWPESGVKTKIYWSYHSSSNVKMQIGFNIYRSLLRNSGYGRVNTTLITSTPWEIVEKARSELFPAYYKLSYVEESGQESDLTGPFNEPYDVQNLTPFALNSFIRKEPSQVEPLGTSHRLTDNGLDEQERGFANGRVKIIFNSGLDAGADLDVYVLCKILPGSELLPSVALEGAPAVRFTLRGKTRPVKSPPIAFAADKLREALTPITVKYYASSESIYLAWDKPKAKEYIGMRIFRTPERQLGDLQAPTPEQEIYNGPGLTQSIKLDLPRNKKVFAEAPDFSEKSEGTLRFAPPPHLTSKPVLTAETNGSNKQGAPKPPILYLFLLGDTITLDHDYYIDSPPKGKTFTYVICGYGENGYTSYPVLVNASLTEPHEGVITSTGIIHPAFLPEDIR